MKRLPLILVATLLLTLSTLAGCEAIQTGLAQAIGAPTPAQVRQVDDKLAELDTVQAQLTTAREQASAHKQEQDKAVQVAQARDAALKKQISDVAQQLASATGEAYDWLSDSLNRLQAQRQALQSGIDEQLVLAGRWQSEIDKLDAALTSTAAARQQAQATLASFGEQRQQAIEGATSGITLLGQAAQDMGAPGADPIAQKLATYAGGVLSVVLGGYALKQRSNAQTATTAAQEIAGSLENARVAVPQLDAALKLSKDVLNTYQGDAAKQIVDQVQKANKTAA